MKKRVRRFLPRSRPALAISSLTIESTRRSSMSSIPWFCRIRQTTLPRFVCKTILPKINSEIRAIFGVAVLPERNALRPLSKGDAPLLPFSSCIRASQGRRWSRFTCVETSNWSEAIPSTKLWSGSSTISVSSYSPANNSAWMGRQACSGFSMGSISHASTPSKQSDDTIFPDSQEETQRREGEVERSSGTT